MNPDPTLPLPLAPSNAPVDANASGAAALTEATADSLDELFSRDIASLEPEARSATVLTIVQELRRMRVKWLAAEAAGATRAPKAAKKAPPAAKTTLEDLGL